MHIERILLRDIGPFDDVMIEFPKGTDPNLADVYLLIGPNGTGKSTVLYAIAAAIAAGRRALGGTLSNNDGLMTVGTLGVHLLWQRMRSRNALVAIQTGDGATVSVVPESPSNTAGIDDPFGGPQLGLITVVEGLAYYIRDSSLFGYARQADQLQATGAGGTRQEFDWAAFAYAGSRSVSDVHITAIQEPKNNPFEHSLSFLQTADTNLLANWIVSQNFRRLKAKEAGHTERAEQLARSVQDIERAIREVVEDPNFAFTTVVDDDDVRVRWQGATVRLGVLPDGLKSIISLVADLLMRLDRIPWQENAPVQQRRFLLLLDEVDIHLHPAWQRRILPLVQQLFPNAQIIASTHSPFVVGSLADGRVISLGLQGSSAKVVHEDTPQLGVSYSAVLRSIFGIESEFDIDTERELNKFHAARLDVIKGDPTAQARLDQIASDLASRSEELREIVAVELRQLQRQLALRATP